MNPLRTGLFAWALLVLLQPAWYLWLAPPANGNGLLALAFTLPPLLLPLLALRTGAKRALLWVGIVALFYFCHGVVAAWVYPSARVPALLEVLLCVVLIATLGWATRAARRRP
ncbi:DUF2069 domain-containing protein [Dokdonella sp.]|uniref:DUF2069 domain-containing protein n=1 Tax=Dokdonella sp. TaxID=2291710 RepID=UPI0026131EEE|nr:DUF2069 domain-containing protein [Dokdonella sp.]